MHPTYQSLSGAAIFGVSIVEVRYRVPNNLLHSQLPVPLLVGMACADQHGIDAIDHQE